MKESIPTFVRAVLCGSFAGGAPFLLLTVPTAIEGFEYGRDLPGLLWLAFMPVVIAGGVVALATLLLGLPLTAWLAHREDETAMTYSIAGFGLGVLLPIAVIAALFGDWTIGAILAVPGAIAGTVTATIWGRWREVVAARLGEPAEAAT